jgi:hypothetical protein
MEWFLTTPDDFSLEQTLENSKGLLLPPLALSSQVITLERVESLASGRTLLLAVREGPAGLYLTTNQQVTGPEIEELSHKTWRMLRLGERFHTFRALMASMPEIQSHVHSSVRLLRGATFFEDVIKAVILAHAGPRAPQAGRQQLTQLIEHVGDALPSNPTRHAFPTPDQIEAQRAWIRTALPAALGETLLALSTIFTEQQLNLRHLQAPETPLTELEATLSTLPGVTPCALALIMLALGRYDYVPENGNARRCLGNSAPPGLERWATTWAPLGGLLYWLWDGSSQPLPSQKE